MVENKRSFFAETKQKQTNVKVKEKVKENENIKTHIKVLLLHNNRLFCVCETTTTIIYFF
jgi:hypothetical protein